MMSCREVTRLLSESHERKLGFQERLSLKVHTMMCKACKNFGVQTMAMSRMMRRYSGKSLPDNAERSAGDE